MKPVYLVTLEYPPQIGGVASYYSQLVAHLPPDTIRVITNEHDQLLHPWWKTWRVLRRALRSHGKGPVLVGQVLPLGTVVWLLSKVSGIQYGVFVHGMDILLPQSSSRKRWLVKHILQAAQVVIANSEFTAHQVRRIAPRASVTVITPGPNVQSTLPAQTLPIPLPAKFILSVGRLVERKGFDQVIQALAQLDSQWADLHYVIAGQGQDRDRLEQLSQSCGVAERVHILSNVSQGQLVTLYQACNFVVQPSRQLPNGDVEGFGITVLEANVFAKPVIAGNAGGMPETVQVGETGLLVDPLDVAAIVQAIQRLLSDPTYCTKLGMTAQHWVNPTHDWNQKAKQLKALLEHL